MSPDDGAPTPLVHSAADSALGFYYQTFFALLILLNQTADDAAVAVERLDDVEIKADGHLLLYQLKHSISATPPDITLKSRALWKTLKLWVDLLPSVTLADTSFHLVAVGAIAADSPLTALVADGSDRDDLVAALVVEAQRVTEARAAAKKLGKALPHADRAPGCTAFLALGDTDRNNLIRRCRIVSGSAAIDKIEPMIANHLGLLPADQRPMVAQQLVQWWDRQIVQSLCGLRDRAVSRLELQHQIMTIVADIEQGKLSADFETVANPRDYQPDGMLARQIELVDGKSSDIDCAIREEWRAREQRAKWVSDNPAMKSRIGEYDDILKEAWSDEHRQMAEDCCDLGEAAKRSSGLKVLRWSHEGAHKSVQPIAAGWAAPYYVRGTYQVLAINRAVGWHPDYLDLLKDSE